MASNLSRMFSSTTNLSRQLSSSPAAIISTSAKRFISSTSQKLHETQQHEKPIAGGDDEKVADEKKSDGDGESDEDEDSLDINKKTGEIGGPKGPEPTRFGDWEKNGRCSDF